MNSFAFEYPWVLILLPLYIICIKKCPAKESALLFPHISMFESVTSKKRFLTQFLKNSTVFLTIVSLAGPVVIDTSMSLKRKGYDIALAIDASSSMKKEGFDKENPHKSRFDVVKELVKDFVEKRKNDNLALIVFGSFAYTASPLTYEKKILNSVIDYLNIGIAGNKTAIIDALIQSVALLKKSEAKSKVIILLTDGLDTASKAPLRVALDMAQKHGIKIYAVAIGDENSIDNNLLGKIAQKSGGEFFYASNAKDLKNIYKKIDELEKSEIRGDIAAKKEPLYIYIQFVAILCLLFYIYFYGRRGI
ncbi:vWA domain-containing protein [Nitrosophilus alvini]|uniref:vWA domain-containing protein n=1 Tax=Nitrosophilus alvini TaxID=2714855 RepID=UPI00190A3C11|nr:VWA domain-containing protein [Nitrosophilus alvini]